MKTIVSAILISLFVLGTACDDTDVSYSNVSTANPDAGSPQTDVGNDIIGNNDTDDSTPDMGQPGDWHFRWDRNGINALNYETQSFRHLGPLHPYHDIGEQLVALIDCYNSDHLVRSGMQVQMENSRGRIHEFTISPPNGLLAEDIAYCEINIRGRCRAGGCSHAVTYTEDFGAIEIILIGTMSFNSDQLSPIPPYHPRVPDPLLFGGWYFTP